MRLGDGTQTLGNTGNSVFIDEYSTIGSLVSSLQIPDSGSSALIMSGNATSEGALSLSGDGRFLAIVGYNTTRPFATSLAASTSTAVNRGIGIIDGNRNYSLAALTSSQFSANNIRGGATDGANNFWGAGGNSGTYYFGNNAPGATVQNAVANTRVIQNFGANLFFSTSSGAQHGIWQISGTPTGAASASVLLNTGTTGSAYDFAFNSAMTVAYVADDGNAAAGAAFNAGISTAPVGRCLILLASARPISALAAWPSIFQPARPLSMRPPPKEARIASSGSPIPAPVLFPPPWRRRRQTRFSAAWNSPPQLCPNLRPPASAAWRSPP